MNEFIITATRSMKEYAARVADYVVADPRFREIAEGINRVDILNTERFADGEMEVSISEPVRGKEVVLFASSCARNNAGLAVEEAKAELYHAVDALKRAQAAKITVFEPFISCSRSDRTTRRNSIGLWMHFKILASLGVRHIVTYQLHSNKSVSMLDPTICTIDNIPVLNLLNRYLCDTYVQSMQVLTEEVRPNWAFCSVDAGGEKFTKEFANAFRAAVMVAHKERDYSKANTVESINILSAEPVEGKTIWIVDDMIDTAGSVESLIRALQPLRPKEINIIAPHAIFSPPAPQRLNKLAEEKLLNRIIVADTVSASPFPGIVPRIEIVPSAKLSAGIIRILTLNESLSKMLSPFDAEKYLKTPSLFNT